MSKELNFENLTDLAVYSPEYLIDAAADAFDNDQFKIESIAIVIGALNELRMPQNALIFVRALAKMFDLEVELLAVLLNEPYLCALFMREFTYWLLEYVSDCFEFSQEE